jgi:hypothetical protein
MQALKDGFYPPGGYRFTETDGTPFEASDVTSLVNKVWGYRRRAGLDATAAQRDVHAQLCTRSPGICQEVGELKRPEPDKVLQGRVAVRAASLLDGRMSKAYRFVDRPEADARARICKGCKFCVDWNSGDSCPPCKKNILEILTVAVKPEALHEGMLGKACRLGGEDLSAEVWTKEHKLLEEAPNTCWRKPQP